MTPKEFCKYIYNNGKGCGNCKLSEACRNPPKSLSNESLNKWQYEIEKLNK